MARESWKKMGMRWSYVMEWYVYIPSATMSIRTGLVNALSRPVELLDDAREGGFRSRDGFIVAVLVIWTRSNVPYDTCEMSAGALAIDPEVGISGVLAVLYFRSS